MDQKNNERMLDNAPILNLTITNRGNSTQTANLFGANLQPFPNASGILNELTYGPVDMVGIAYNPVSNTMYFPRRGFNNIGIIDCDTNLILGTIATGTNSYKIAYDSANNRMYVTSASVTDVIVIDCTTNTVIATIAIGTTTSGIAYNPSLNTIYVSEENGANLYLISTITNTLINTVNIGTVVPLSLAYCPVNNFIYCCDASADTVVAFNCGNNTFTTIPVPFAGAQAPTDFAYNNQYNIMYVSCPSGNHVLILDCATNSFLPTQIAYLGVGNNYEGIAYNSTENTLLISDETSGDFFIVDCQTNTIIDTITSTADKVYCCGYSLGSNTFISLGRIPIGFFFGGIVISIGPFILIVPDYNVSYGQVLRGSNKNSFVVGVMRMQSTNTSQVIQPVTITEIEIYGNVTSDNISMVSTLSEYQYNNEITRSVDEEILITGNRYLSIPVLALTSFTCTFYIKRKLDSSKMLHGLSPLQFYANDQAIVKPMYMRG